MIEAYTSKALQLYMAALKKEKRPELAFSMLGYLLQLLSQLPSLAHKIVCTKKIRNFFRISKKRNFSMKKTHLDCSE
jgi:hypothetical protein